MILSPYTTVKAIIFAVIGKFNQAPDINIAAVVGVADLAGPVKEIIGEFPVSVIFDQQDPFLLGKPVFER